MNAAAVHAEGDLDSDATPEQRAKLLELTERYRVVLQSIRTTPRIGVTA